MFSHTKVQLHIWLDQQHNAAFKFVVEQQYNLVL